MVALVTSQGPKAWARNAYIQHRMFQMNGARSKVNRKNFSTNASQGNLRLVEALTIVLVQIDYRHRVDPRFTLRARQTGKVYIGTAVRQGGKM